jgi:hypothetical protein
MILPTSYVIPSQELSVGHRPVALGGFGDVFKGILNGSGVCVKRVRMYSQDDPQKPQKVRYLDHCLFSLLLLTKLPGPLSRGYLVEAPKTRKHCSFFGCHCDPSSTHLGMDAPWRLDGIHRTAPRWRPVRPRRCPFQVFDLVLISVTSSLMSPKDCIFSTLAISFMAISKGYVVHKDLNSPQC